MFFFQSGKVTSTKCQKIQSLQAICKCIPIFVANLLHTDILILQHNIVFTTICYHSPNSLQTIFFIQVRNLPLRLQRIQYEIQYNLTNIKDSKTIARLTKYKDTLDEVSLKQSIT